jgi:hypothetical protein
MWILNKYHDKEKIDKSLLIVSPCKNTRCIKALPYTYLKMWDQMNTLNHLFCVLTPLTNNKSPYPKP